MDRAARPAGSAGNPARVQQDQTLHDDWAYDADSQAEAEHLARLEGDEDLLLTLQLGGFSEAVWSPVANELARYGLAVMKSWIRKRSIFSKVKQKTGHRLHMIDGWPDDEDLIDQLATDTVVAALGHFKDNVLMPGKWDPRRGASLRTFFIGQCVFQFPNRYKPRVDEEVRRRAGGVRITCTDDLAPFDGTAPGVDTAALQAVELVEALGSIKDRRAAAAFVLQAQGYPHAQIAERLGLADAKSAENLIRYNANKIKKRRSS